MATDSVLRSQAAPVSSQETSFHPQLNVSAGPSREPMSPQPSLRQRSISYHDQDKPTRAARGEEFELRPEQAPGAAPASPSRAPLYRRTWQNYQTLSRKTSIYLSRPEQQRTVSDLRNAFVGTAFALGAGWGLSAIGVTGALTGIFVGQSGIENLASSLPWVGSMLGSLIGKGDIYGVASTAFMVETLRRCLMPEESGGQTSSAAWWAFHIAAAFAISPLFVPGAVISTWAVAGATLGVWGTSYSAGKALRETHSADVEHTFCICMLAWGISAMPANVLQTALPNKALVSALSVPTLAVILVVARKLGNSLLQRFNFWGSAGPSIERLERKAVFASTENKPRNLTGVRIVPDLEPRALASDWIKTLQMANRDHTDAGTPVLWISGRAHDGKQEAAAAFAQALGHDLPVIIDPDHLPEHRKLPELIAKLKAVAEAAQRKNRYEVVAIRNIERLVPKKAGQGDREARSKILKEFASSQNIQSPRIVFLALSEDEEPGSFEAVDAQSSNASTRTIASDNIDDAAKSRMGIKFTVAPPTQERWHTVLPFMIHEAMNTAPTALPLREQWPDPTEAEVLKDSIAQLAERGERHGWDMGYISERLRDVQRRLSRKYNEAKARNRDFVSAVHRQFLTDLREELSRIEGKRTYDSAKLARQLVEEEDQHAQQVQLAATVPAAASAAWDHAMQVSSVNAAGLLEAKLTDTNYDAETDGSSGIGSEDESADETSRRREQTSGARSGNRFQRTSAETYLASLMALEEQRHLVTRKFHQSLQRSSASPVHGEIASLSEADFGSARSTVEQQTSGS